MKNNKFKKIFVILCAVLGMVSLLASCKKQEEIVDTPSPTTSVEEPAVTDDATPVGEETNNVEETSPSEEETSPVSQ